MVLCLQRIYRDLPLYNVFWALPIADWLSQCILIAGTRFGQLGISSKKFRSHSAFSPALSNAMNSDSIVDRAIYIYLEDFHDTAAPPSVKTNPLVDLESAVSDIQLASLYPSRTAGYLV